MPEEATGASAPPGDDAADESGAGDDRHLRLKALFTEVCDLPPAARAARLATLTGDPDLIAQTLNLAAESDRHTAGTVGLSVPIVALMEGAAGPELDVGDTVGAWKLEAALGEGGMGSVFLAARNDGHFQQTAAIKILQGLPTEEALGLLAKERQILALLKHPNIAHLLDGGATPRGRPYLVIEYVEGLPIDAYCRRRALATTAILRLMRTVCHAVSFAHQRLIVHCDIKPSNVLVDQAGRPVLLDFGIARLAEQTTAHASVTGADAAQPAVTTPPLRAFTPRYASPEQRDGGVVGTASDVYGLGVLLGELLGIAVPGAAVTAPDAQSTATGPARTRDRSPLAQRELTAIVGKATAARPADRYTTVETLAEDIERFLAREPLRAIPPTPAYRLRKLGERRWGALLAAALFTVTVIGFTWRVVQERNAADVARVEAVQQRDIAVAAENSARADRDRAERAGKEALDQRNAARSAEQDALAQRNLALAAEEKAKRSEATARQETNATREVGEFMESLFASADPEAGNDAALTAIALVERGRQRIETELKDQPATRASLQSSLGRVYENIGKPREALTLYENAVAVERAVTPPRPLQLARLLSRLAVLRTNLFTMAAAEAPAREALALIRKHAPENSSPGGSGNSPQLADALNTLGLTLTSLGKYGEAEPMLLESLRIREGLGDKGSDSYGSTLHNLGLHYRLSGELELAESAYRRAVVVKTATIGERHPRTSNSVIGLAQSLTLLRRVPEAEALLRQNLALRRELYAHDTERVSHAIHELAAVVRDAGRYRESIELTQEGLAIDAIVFGKASQKYAIPLNGLGGAYDDLGETALAEATYRQSLDIRSKALPDGDLAVARARHNLGRFLMRNGNLDEALPLLNRAYDVRRKAYSGEHAEITDSAIVLAEWHLMKGDLAEADRRLGAIRDAALRARPPQRAVYERVAALLAARRGDIATALAGLQQYEASMRSAYGDRHPKAQVAPLERAELLAAAGKPKEARELARAIETELSATLAAGAPVRGRLASVLAADAR